MRMLRQILFRFGSLFGRGRREREMQEEMAAHLEMQEQANRARGMDAEEARYAALRQFGGVAQVQERCREQRGWAWLESLGRDLRVALRSLGRAPGFAAVVVLTLALGIGANTAVFCVLNAVLSRRAGCVDPERVVVVHGSTPNFPGGNLSVPDYLDYRAQMRSVAELAAHRSDESNLTGRGEPRSIGFTRATANYFAVYGVRPVLGRVFGEDEDRSGAEGVAVLSHGLWQQVFGGRDEALGQHLMIGGAAYTVIGVMPAEFTEVATEQVWVPMAFTDEERSANARGSRGYSVIGRLAPGATVATAGAEFGALASRLQTQYPDFNGTWGVRVVGLLDDSFRELRPLLWILLGAVACVLAIVCANIANLVLARSSARMAEMAVRASLGASRGRIAQQFLVEGLVLAVAGGVLGFVFLHWGVAGLLRLLPGGWNADVRIDGWVLAFAGGVSVMTGLVFGLVPLSVGVRSDLYAEFKRCTRGASGGGRLRLGRWLVAAEIALAFVLLYGAGLLASTLRTLAAVDLGFDPANSSRIVLNLPEVRYGEHEQRVVFVRQLVEHLAALPGVTAAGATQCVPISGNWSVSFSVAGRPNPPGAKPSTCFYAGTPGFFPALGVTLQRGRAFSEHDDERGAPVAIVNESFARRVFPGEDPLGRRIWLQNGPEKFAEIVGVVSDVRQGGPAQPSLPQTYQPLAQWSCPMVNVIVRTAPGVELSEALLRAQVYAVDPDQPVAFVEPMTQLVGSTVARQRAAVQLVGVFSAVALGIAVLGIYGVTAYTVARRTREFGVRLALGASPGGLVRGVLAGHGRWILLGLGAGLLVALGAAHALRSLLHGTTVFDGPVLAAIIACFGSVALVACWLPARRAARVDPTETLRAE